MSRSNNCEGVCAEVRERLEKVGVLATKDPKHGPVFTALDAVVLVKKEDLQLLTKEQLVERYKS